LVLFKQSVVIVLSCSWDAKVAQPLGPVVVGIEAYCGVPGFTLVGLWFFVKKLALVACEAPSAAVLRYSRGK
jgi:hypothetical protein